MPGRFMVDGTVGSSFTGQQLSNGEVLFEHDGSETELDSLEFDVRDESGLTSQPVSLSFEFSSNTAPVFSTETVFGDENKDIPFASSNFIVNDSEQSQDDIRFSLDELPSFGTLFVDSVALTSTGHTFAYQDLENSEVIFTPHEDVSGIKALVFNANDQQGGVSEASLTVDIEGTNDEPSIETSDVVVANGEQITLTTSHIVVSDPESELIDLKIGYDISESFDGEIIIDNGIETLSEGDFLYISYSDFSEGVMHYVSSGSGGGNDKITFAVSDGENSDTADLK